MPISDNTPSAERGAQKFASTLYVKRRLLNAGDLVAWAKRSGCEKTLPPEDMHVTVAYSREVVEWPEPPMTSELVVRGGKRGLKAFGPNNDVTVLTFPAPELVLRWDSIRAKGASWDHAAYEPHVTISHDPENTSLLDAEPYQGPLVFGPEVFEKVNENWSAGINEKRLVAKVNRVDAELGLVFGWAIVSNIEGEPYFDLQDDHIPEPVMLKASAAYMAGDRVAGDMHQWVDGKPLQIGKILFAWPVTQDVSKAVGINSKQTGLLIGMKVDTPEVLAKFKSGEYTGFSLGGYLIRSEETA
jgi:hypothetical protein